MKPKALGILATNGKVLCVCLRTYSTTIWRYSMACLSSSEQMKSFPCGTCHPYFIYFVPLSIRSLTLLGSCIWCSPNLPFFCSAYCLINMHTPSSWLNSTLNVITVTSAATLQHCSFISI